MSWNNFKLLLDYVKNVEYSGKIIFDKYVNFFVI